MRREEQELLQPVYEQYKSDVRRVIRKFGINSGMDIDDIVQETFISLFNVYELDWNEKRTASTMYTITRNKCMDYYRKNKKEMPVSLEQIEIQENPYANAGRLERDPAEIVVENESYEELKNQINGISSNWNTVATLYFEEEKPIREISAMMGITEQACRARIYRIRVFLKKLLRP